MRLYAVDAPVVGEFCYPQPLNRELRQLVERVNRLDHWALAATPGNSKVRPGAFGRSVVVGTETPQTITFPGDSDGLTPPHRETWRPVPDATGAPWATTITTGDAVLEVSWSCLLQLDFDSGVGEVDLLACRFVVFVDGLPVAGPFSTYGGQWDSTPVHGHVPVAAGAHLVQPMLHVVHLNAADSDITFDSRQLVLIEKAR